MPSSTLSLLMSRWMTEFSCRNSSACRHCTQHETQSIVCCAVLYASTNQLRAEPRRAAPSQWCRVPIMLMCGAARGLLALALALAQGLTVAHNAASDLRLRLRLRLEHMYSIARTIGACPTRENPCDCGTRGGRGGEARRDIPGHVHKLCICSLKNIWHEHEQQDAS